MTSTIEARIDKSIKKRGNKSPLSSTAAETLLLLTKQIERPDIDLNVCGQNLISTKRNNSDVFKKSFRRTQSTEYLKIISEKNNEIRKLHEDNQYLSSQLTDFSGLVKKYQKLRGLLKEKDQTIESLRNSVEKERGGKIHVENLDLRKARKATSGKKKIFKVSSRLSLDNGYNSYDVLSSRPMTAANKGVVKKVSPVKSKASFENISLPTNMCDLIYKTERVLKGWKTAYKNKKKS